MRSRVHLIYLLHILVFMVCTVQAITNQLVVSVPLNAAFMAWCVSDVTRCLVCNSCVKHRFMMPRHVVPGCISHDARCSLHVVRSRRARCVVACSVHNAVLLSCCMAHGAMPL